MKTDLCDARARTTATAASYSIFWLWERNKVECTFGFWRRNKRQTFVTPEPRPPFLDGDAAGALLLHALATDLPLHGPDPFVCGKGTGFSMG